VSSMSEANKLCRRFARETGSVSRYAEKLIN